MKIAVSATAPDLDAAVDTHFGRCACFLIVDADNMEFGAVENPNIALGAGAGIQSARLVAQKGAEAVLTRNCGPNAFETLAAAGVKVIIGCSGKARDVVEAFKARQLSPAGESNVPGHSGTGAGQGMGRGTGRGMGRGMGRRTGRGMGATPPPASQAPTGEGELEWLKQQSEALARQLQQIQARVEQLEAEE